MTKNPNFKSYSAASSRKGSASHDSSPLHSSKTKKETIYNRYQPSELDSHLRVSSKSSTRKQDAQPLTTNVFINNLNVQINSSQNQQKRVATPLSATISNRKNSKQYGGLSQKEEAALAEYRESKSRQKSRVPSAPVTFEEALPPNMLHGASFDLRKNPMAIIPRHHSEASNELSKSSYMAKFKGSDPNNKFGLKSPAKVFTQPQENATKFKKPNTRAQQKSFDLNAGVPLGKYTPYLNAYMKPTSTANNSPRNNDQEKRVTKPDNGAHLSNSIGPKVIKTSLEKTPSSAKPSSKSPLVSKHRKTPSYDVSRRENPPQKTMTPPMLDRMRRSADFGDHSQKKTEPFKKNLFRFAIRTRAGVAPNGTRKVNQDSFIFHTNYAKKSDRYLLGVCDGHGINGHLVSGFVKEAIPVFLATDPNFEKNVGQAFVNSFELCHQKLQTCDFDCKFSGTTSVVLLIDGNRIISANAGDSRALMGSFTQGMGWDYTLLSEDHKPNSPLEAQRIMKAGGRIEPFRDGDGGFVGPHRVWLMNQDIPGLAMARSIGDFVAASVGVSCTPEIKEFTINPNDRFMIVASDGIWEFIESIDVVKIIIPFYEQNNIEGACDYLLGLALKAWQEEEEVVVDDITLILVFF